MLCSQGKASCCIHFTQEEGTTTFLQLFQQKFAAIHPIIRVNATSLIVYRLRNHRELESFLEEVSGLSSKKELLQIYKVATEDEYSFLYVNLAARTIKEMFFKNFTARIELEDESND